MMKDEIMMKAKGIRKYLSKNQTSYRSDESSEIWRLTVEYTALD